MKKFICPNILSRLSGWMDRTFSPWRISCDFWWKTLSFRVFSLVLLFPVPWKKKILFLSDLFWYFHGRSDNSHSYKRKKTPYSHIWLLFWSSLGAVSVYIQVTVGRQKNKSSCKIRWITPNFTKQIQFPTQKLCEIKETQIIILYSVCNQL